MAVGGGGGGGGTRTRKADVSSFDYRVRGRRRRLQNEPATTPGPTMCPLRVTMYYGYTTRIRSGPGPTHAQGEW